MLNQGVNGVNDDGINGYGSMFKGGEVSDIILFYHDLY